MSKGTEEKPTNPHKIFSSLKMLLCLRVSCNKGCFLVLCSPRTLRSKKQQSTSGGLSLSLSQAATPRKTLSFSAVSTPVNNSSSSTSILQEGSTQCDGAHQLSSILDQPHLRQRTITTTTTTTTASVDGHWGQWLNIWIYLK